MSTEMCDFVKLVLDRMDTNPEEFIDGDPKHRWGTLTRGIIDRSVGEADTSSSRSLWALEPHELQAITTKYKAIYLESQKRAFLKNILGADENQGKKLNITKRATPMTAPDITRHALQIMEDEWGKSWNNSTQGQNALLGTNTLPVGNGNIAAGYIDARAQYANERPAKVVKRQNEPDNN